MEKPDEYLWTPAAWEDLNTAEDLDLSFAKADDVESIKETHPWLSVCESVAGTRASITGSSTLPLYSPAADLIFRWGIRRGCGRDQMKQLGAG